MMRRSSLLLSLWLGFVWGQTCPTAFPSLLSCSGCTPLTVRGDGTATVPPNQTRCVLAGWVLTVKSLLLEKNSTLLVCGTLIVEEDLNLGEAGSSIHITPGGSLVVQGSTSLNNASSIYNWGVFSAPSLTLNGSQPSFWNIGAGAQLNVSGNIIVNANTQFINHQGIINGSSLTLNGNATACLSQGACISVRSFTSNGNGAIQVTGSAPVALSFTGTATLNSQVTSSSLLYVCQAPGATVNNPSNWGSAQVTQNCTSGCGVLPVKALTLKARREGDQLVLEWRCSLSCARFRVKLLLERESAVLWEGPGMTFAVAERLLPSQSVWTFQVAALGPDGQELSRATVSLPAAEGLSLKLFPSPFAENLSYAWNGEEPAVLHWFSAAGQEVGQVQVLPGVGSFQALENGVVLASLPKGAYLVRVTLSSGHLVGTFPLIKAE